MSFLSRYKKISDGGKFQGLVQVVGDAAIAASPFVEGRLVPLVIVDTSGRPDLEELVRVHKHLPPGDVETQWG